jgi:hypothetical protein
MFCPEGIAPTGVSSSVAGSKKAVEQAHKIVEALLRPKGAVEFGPYRDEKTL